MNKQQLFFDSLLPNVLNKDELIEYFKKMNLGDDAARDIIIYHNIRLVLSIIHKKFNNIEYHKQDLLSAGLIGLIKSVDSFDLEKGTSFFPYASKCIENEILMYIKKEKKYVNMIKLDKPMNGYGFTIKDILRDDGVDIISSYEIKEEYKFVRHFINNLTELERKIIILYFGFNIDKCYSQQEIASIIGYSQSYVSRILNKIIYKFKIAYNDLDKANLKKILTRQ